MSVAAFSKGFVVSHCKNIIFYDDMSESKLLSIVIYLNRVRLDLEHLFKLKLLPHWGILKSEYVQINLIIEFFLCVSCLITWNHVILARYS